MKYLFLSAWNDSGGGYTHRLFDSHLNTVCWPFELQLGVDQSQTILDQWFKPKYRWPQWDGVLKEANPAHLFDIIIDEELKDVLRDPKSAKHKAYFVDANLEEWKVRFIELWNRSDYKRSDWIKSYIESFLSSWKNKHIKSEQASLFISHCPVLNLDSNLIFEDFPDAHILQVIRSPFSGFMDMKGRHPNLDANMYALKWSLVNQAAALASQKWPNNFRIIFFEDLLADCKTVLNDAAQWVGIDNFIETPIPFWNGIEVSPRNMGPFGGVPDVSVEHEKKCISMLDEEDAKQIEKVTYGTQLLLSKIKNNYSPLNFGDT